MGDRCLPPHPVHRNLESQIQVRRQTQVSSNRFDQYLIADLHDAFRGPLSPPPPDVDVGKIQGSDPAGDGAQSDRIPPAPKSPLSKTPRSGDDPSVVNQSGPVGEYHTLTDLASINLNRNI